MRISDWSSDVCSSDLIRQNFFGLRQFFLVNPGNMSLLYKQEADTYTLSQDAKTAATLSAFVKQRAHDEGPFKFSTSTEEHTSELQSLMRISYAVFCLTKTHIKKITHVIYVVNHTNHKLR